MTQITSPNSNRTRILIIVLIAAMTQSIVIGIHESVHALSCIIVGREVVEYSALHVDCQPEDALSTATKLTAGSAAVVNVILGTILFFVLRSGVNVSNNWKWFLWLFMFANWSNGFGYLIFSGVSGAGDYAAVIAGWQPDGLWQLVMLAVGAGLWFGAVWLSLRVLAQIFGGDDQMEIRSRFLRLSIPSYFSAVIVMVCAGLLNMHGFLGLPSVAGIMAAAGTLSPLLWTPYWFASNSFTKKEVEKLIVSFDMKWVIIATIVCFFYIIVLGRGFAFAPVG